MTISSAIPVFDTPLQFVCKTFRTVLAVAGSATGQRTIIAFLIMAALGSAGYGQTHLENFKILASDGGVHDEFGRSVSLDGDLALLSAHYHDGTDVDSGAAYVFRRSNSQWLEEAELLPSDGAAYDWFGYSVSLSGSTALIGAYGHDANGPASGAAYLFRHDGTGWIEQAKLLASDGEEYDRFGWCVSLSGDTALIGLLGDDDQGQQSGSAYIFHFDGTNWVEETKLLPSDGEAQDAFGFSVSLSGETALIGAGWDDDNGTDAGAAYLFRHDGTGWIEEAKLLASDGEAGDNFGYSVSLSGDAALIGARNDDDSAADAGAAYLFRHDGTGWIEEAKLLASDGEEADRFGRSLTISGDLAIVGAHAHDATGDDSGAAYLFLHQGKGWIQKAMLQTSDGEAGDRFGFGATLNGETALVGARADEDNGYDSGSAYVFDIDWIDQPVSAYLCCNPSAGTLPFVTTMKSILNNAVPGQTRRIAGRIGVYLAGGQYISNWRSGWTNIAPLQSHTTAWPQSLPAVGPLVGMSTFRLRAEDVTPPPYNQPPYAPSGESDTDTCTLQAVAPR